MVLFHCTSRPNQSSNTHPREKGHLTQSRTLGFQNLSLLLADSSCGPPIPSGGIGPPSMVGNLLRVHIGGLVRELEWIKIGKGADPRSLQVAKTKSLLFSSIQRPKHGNSSAT